MGLAASQARLLFITSRQNDVSAKMQRISNQTMILARDSEEVSDKYNRMLNGESYTIVGTNGENSLSYEQLMGADAAANGTLSIISDVSGRPLLSSSLVSQFGLSGKAVNGIGSASDFNTANPTLVDLIKRAVTDPTTQAGVLNAIGETPNLKNDVLNDEMKSKLNEFQKKFGFYPTKTSEISINDILKDMGDFKVANVTSKSNGTVEMTDQTSVQNSRLKSFTDIADLNAANTGKNLYLLAQYEDISNDSVTSKAVEAADKLKSVTETIAGKIIQAAGISSSKAVETEVTNIYKEASNIAGQITHNSGLNKGGNCDGNEDDSIAIATMSAQNTVFGFGVDDTGDDSLIFFTDLSTVTKRLLEALIKDAEDGCGVKATTSGKYGYVNDKTNYSGNTSKYSDSGDYGDLNITTVYKGYKISNANEQFSLVINNQGYGLEEYEKELKKKLGVSTISDEVKNYLTPQSSTTTTSNNSNSSIQNYYSNLATYYANLYNKLSTKGWTEGSTDTATLNEKLKNGTYIVNGNVIANNENVYQKDDKETAKAKAEAYYDSEMLKINNKEKRLERELSKLQTEYSSLTTDYESVKSIITANIGKSFTYCQNG